MSISALASYWPSGIGGTARTAALAAEPAVQTGAPVVSSVRTSLRSVTLRWSENPDSDYYEVYIQEGTAWRRKNKLTEPNVTYQYMVLGEEYNFKIRAHTVKNGVKAYTDFSDIIHVELEDLAPQVTAKMLARKTFLLSWSPVENCDSYEIYRQVGENGSWNRYKTVAGSAQSESIAISLNTRYHFKVRAHIANEAGSFYGSFSEPVLVEYTVPVVGPLQSVLTGFSKVDLSWAPIENCDYYEVYRKIGDGAWTRNKITADTSVSYSLSKNQTYSYKVRGHVVLENEKFFTAYSEITEVSTVAPSIENFELQKNGSQSVQITWDELSYTDYYEIYRLKSKTGSWGRNQVIYAPCEQSYTVKAGTFYGYKVRARLDKDGERVYTDFTSPIYYWNVGAPNIRADEMSGKQMVISWDAVALADKYRIYSDGAPIGETTALTYQVPSAYLNTGVTVSAILLTVNTEVESERSAAIVYEVPAEVHYRALLIGETDYSTRLNGPDNDADFMNGMLKSLTNGYEVYAQKNATLDEMIELIDIAFADATEQDVSLFYYSGHGVTGSNEYYSGALQTVDYQYLTTMDLAELLSNIPGKVIVILDSCGSGAAITDEPAAAKTLQISENGLQSTEAEALNAEADALGFDPEQFNNGVLAAFNSYDSSIGTTGGSSKPGGPRKAGELRQTKFHVITSSSYEENSITSQIDGIWGGVLTRGIAAAVGCSYPDGNYSGSMPADTNEDSCISFSELESYCKTYAIDSQTVLSYSNTPGLKLFLRTSSDESLQK